MASLFTADSHSQVRAALDLRLKVGNLPDEIIEQPIFVDEAVEAVIVADPAAASYDEVADTVKLERARRACVYLVAAQLAAPLPNLTQLQLGDTRLSWKEWDAAKKEAELRGKAQAVLAKNTETDGLVPFATQFTTAPGYRGR